MPRFSRKFAEEVKIKVEVWKIVIIVIEMLAVRNRQATGLSDVFRFDSMPGQTIDNFPSKGDFTDEITQKFQ